MQRCKCAAGAFNSWDRQPFYVTLDGKDTYVPKYRTITRNLWFNNYNPQESVDNDDGSCWYETHHNVFPFASGGLKNDFGGHDNHHHNNLYYNSNSCMGVCAQKPGHEDHFYNNTCVINKASPTYAGAHHTIFSRPLHSMACRYYDMTWAARTNPRLATPSPRSAVE
eukprot:SAG11_NODE_476_length_9118_cov_5.515911_10_plen_167_part_00